MPATTKRPARKRAPDLEAQLAEFIGKDIMRRELTQLEAARLMRDAPSQLSLVMNQHTRGFSAKRLMRMITHLGYGRAHYREESAHQNGRYSPVIVG